MMTAYENMYRALFSGISNAILNIEENNFGLAKDTLIKAKKEAEDLFTDIES